jgi:hypothetical protein
MLNKRNQRVKPHGAPDKRAKGEEMFLKIQMKEDLFDK